MVQQNASDLHLKVGRPPTLRVNGDLVAAALPALRPEDLKALAEELMTPKQVKEFAEYKEARLRHRRPGHRPLPRQRVPAARHDRATRCASSRTRRSTIAELNLPPVVEEIALKPRGLVLVTGITGRASRRRSRR